MEIEIKNSQVESVVIQGNVQDIIGVKSAKTFKSFCQAKINHFSRFPEAKYTGKDIEMLLRGFLGVYDKFHPETKIDVKIESWKGKSGVQIIEYPEYFECIEFRKPDEFNEPKELHHKVYKNVFNDVYKAFQSIETGKRYKTSEFAEIWARTNHIWENADGNRIIDNNGFNFANISGCRRTYFDFYYSIKVLEKHYKVIKYEKSGHLTKIKEDI